MGTKAAKTALDAIPGMPPLLKWVGGQMLDRIDGLFDEDVDLADKARQSELATRLRSISRQTQEHFVEAMRGMIEEYERRSATERDVAVVNERHRLEDDHRRVVESLETRHREELARVASDARGRTRAQLMDLCHWADGVRLEVRSAIGRWSRGDVSRRPQLAAAPSFDALPDGVEFNRLAAARSAVQRWSHPDAYAPLAATTVTLNPFPISPEIARRSKEQEIDNWRSAVYSDCRTIATRAGIPWSLSPTD